MTFLTITVLCLIALTMGSLWWRWESRRRSLPCPTWFADWLMMSFGRKRLDKLIGTQTTLDRISLRPGQRVLEVGPGPGRLLLPAAQRVLPGGEAVGLDIQASMIDRLMQRAAKEGISNVTAIVGDAAESHFNAGSFDVVFLCTVLGEIPRREEAFRQCHAVLKPGGLLSVTEVFPDPHYQSFVTVKRLAEAGGFRIREKLGRWYFFTANFIKA